MEQELQLKQFLDTVKKKIKCIQWIFTHALQ